MEHTTKALKRRYRSVKGLVSDYNKRRLCMIKLRGRGGIPKNAIIPPPIDMKGLFGLDVDNDIWQDIGLADDEFDGKVPPWLGDDNVRNGIRLMQEVKNCRDELHLCDRERSSLQQWFEEESAALMAVFNACKGEYLLLSPQSNVLMKYVLIKTLMYGSSSRSVSNFSVIWARDGGIRLTTWRLAMIRMWPEHLMSLQPE